MSRIAIGCCLLAGPPPASAAERYDVVGGGVCTPGGITAAVAAARNGRSVVGRIRKHYVTKYGDDSEQVKACSGECH